MVIIGARQVGKTTLSNVFAPHLPYHNLDAAEIRFALADVPATLWARDVGLQRRLSGRTSELSGEVYENYVIAEIHKWNRTMRRDAQMLYYRTISGMEVDLLLQTSHGVIACEIKQRATIETRDARHLVRIAEALGSEWRGGIVTHKGTKIHRLCEPGI